MPDEYTDTWRYTCACGAKGSGCTIQGDGMDFRFLLDFGFGVSGVGAHVGVFVTRSARGWCVRFKAHRLLKKGFRLKREARGCQNLDPHRPPTFCVQDLLHINVQRFRGGLVFMAHSRLYHTTLGLIVIQKKKTYFGVWRSFGLWMPTGPDPLAERESEKVSE